MVVLIIKICVIWISRHFFQSQKCGLFFGPGHAIHCCSHGTEDLPLHAPLSRFISPFHASRCSPLGRCFICVLCHAWNPRFVSHRIDNAFWRKTEAKFWNIFGIYGVDYTSSLKNLKGKTRYIAVSAIVKIITTSF